MDPAASPPTKVGSPRARRTSAGTGSGGSVQQEQHLLDEAADREGGQPGDLQVHREDLRVEPGVEVPRRRGWVVVGGLRRDVGLLLRERGEPGERRALVAEDLVRRVGQLPPS
jgi:hypothetical protein